MKNDSTHLRFAVLAADAALFTIRHGEICVRLINVNRPPHFKNIFGLPGGLLQPKETAEEAAVRHLEEKAGVAAEKLYIEQLYTFSEVGRDPRGRVVAVAYIALVPWDSLSTEEQSNEHGARWVPVRQARSLAYDHDQILNLAITRLRSRVHYTTLISKLMHKEFTLTELEKTYEAIIKTDLDKRNFRKKILKLKILTPLPRKRAHGAHRPAQLYKFSSEKVVELEML